MKILIVANWKMNPSTEKEAVRLFRSVKEGIKNLKNVEVIICPPFPYISALGRFSFKNLSIGGQNVFYEEKGAFTGEVSALMLMDLGVKYVILGHSEARKYLKETDEVINKKIKEVLSSELKPILCVGEENEENKLAVLENQVTNALKGVLKNQLKNIIIAYEPVWAIGTLNNCPVDKTLSSVLFIKKVIAEIYNRKSSDSIRVIYGGSVDSNNSGQYIKESGVKGLLVGGNSLDSKEFVKIAKSADF